MSAPEERRGLADLHVHTLASDGTASVAEVLDHAERRTHLDVIAITDHERIDAALAARAMARARGMRVQVVVGEEVTTRHGHLLGLFLEQRVRPLRSLAQSIADVHEQGGVAVVAHPLVPFPLCASARTLRRLLADPDPLVHPDGLEAFNPTSTGRRWHPRVVAFARQHGLAELGNSDAHDLEAIGRGWTTFPGRTPEDLRRAILSRETAWQGSFYPPRAHLVTFSRQLRKYGRDVRDEAVGRVLRRGTGRDLGYPGGRLRPPRFKEPEAAG